ncbi:hypothetical protein PR048_009042 [Dryococelus australis]|uniref:Integrase catalytic domain-containing protein n=1 Tax=Dryococelus australis TaxID=614101 RepID=A0ABQ9HYT2_9NEOP|nr:hypothetical protein PR048_009042 [Dryococelus australis]
MLEKQERERERESARPLEIIHIDFVTFLDDYTHFSVICLVKNKADVCDAARNCIAEAESKWNSCVNKLSCDMRGEYVANELTDWCRERGIKIDYAPAATPQQNLRAESLNKTLMEKMRALLLDSGLAKELSQFATVNTTPPELWYGKRPDLSNLKLFGSLAYAKTLKTVGKLDEICDKLFMLGYATNCYRLWNSENREIKLSRDVTFVESTEVSATNNSSQEIIADTVSLVYSEETSLRLADDMEVRRNTTVLQDDNVDEHFHVFPSNQDTAKTSEMLDSLPESATEI